jgi:hypothetical protein
MKIDQVLPANGTKARRERLEQVDRSAVLFCLLLDIGPPPLQVLFKARRLLVDVCRGDAPFLEIIGE